MRIQWEILLFIFCLNLAIGLTIQLGFAGVSFVSPAQPGVNATEYESHFNSTKIAIGWAATPFSGIPLIGDIFAGFNFLYQNLGYLIDGFPILLGWIKDSFITDDTGRLVFDVLANALRALYALLISMFLIEYISGRNVSD